MKSSGEEEEGEERQRTGKDKVGRTGEGSEGGDSNELLDWDDDNFELDDPIIKTPNAADTGSTAAEETTKDNQGYNQPKGGNEEEDWLMMASSTAAATTNDQPKNQTTTSSSSDSYLTKQFRSLNTPVSMKKARCSECTRPLSMTAEVRKLSHLCDKCYYAQTK